MTLHSIFADLKNYSRIGFDREEMEQKFGANPKFHIDVNHQVKSYADSWQPISIHFDSCGGVAGDAIPDITELQGRLFMNGEVYKLLRPILANDGEFLPISYGKEEWFIFNPMRVAESVNGLNIELSQKNSWGEIESMSFHEERVSQFMVFRSEFDLHLSIMCQDLVKTAVESAGFDGVFFTQDLGNRFTSNMSGDIQTN